MRTPIFITGVLVFTLQLAHNIKICQLFSINNTKISKLKKSLDMNLELTEISVRKNKKISYL